MCKDGGEHASRIPSSVGQAACGIVHDLSNLIQTIILRAEVTAATEPVSAACIKRMEQIVDDGQGGANLIRGLLEYARKAIDSLEPVDVRKTVEDCVAWLNACGSRLALEVEEKEFPARFDLAQLWDLIDLINCEARRDASPVAEFSLLLRHAKPGGEALAWMSEENWLEIRLTRVGAGAPVDLDEGNLFKSGSGAPAGEHSLGLMRIRGIVRQHRGQVRTVEQVEDGRQTLSVEVYFPLFS